MNKLSALCSGICLLFVSNLTAGVIDFETTASGGTPTDNGVIELTDRFSAGSVGVRFGFDTNFDGILDGKAVFEDVNNVDANNDSGFWSLNSARDKAAAGYEDQLGDFFIRQLEPYQPFGVFTILYDSINPVTEASGEIWDIDGTPAATERYLVKAFNGDNLLDSIESPLGDGNTLDGKPWTFGFSGLTNITKIEITFTGSKTGGIGLAFNNFSPVEDIRPTVDVSEPSSILLLSFALVGLLMRRPS